MSALMKEEWETGRRTRMPRPSVLTERRGLRLLEPQAVPTDSAATAEEPEKKLVLSVALFAYLYIP